MIWTTKKLGELLILSDPGIWGLPINKSGEGVFVLRSTNILEDGSLDFSEIAERKVEDDKINNLYLQNGDILLEKSGGGPEQPVGRVAYFMAPDNQKYIFSNFIQRLRPKINLINSRFLFFYLFYIYKTGLTQKFQSQTTGIRNLNLKLYFNIKIPVPPLTIQQKIVERLDEIRKAQELNDKQIELAEELFQSLLHRELDPKGKNWEVKYLREICKIKGGKRVPKGEHLLDIKTDHPYIRVIDFKDFSVDLSNLKYINQKIFEKIKDYIVREDDIYISIAGTTGLVGIIPKILDGANLTENAAKLIIERKNEIDKWYLVYFLFSNYGQNQIRISTYAPGVPKLALYRLEKIKIPLPPLETQQKIVEKLSAVQEYKKKLLERKQKLQELFESVLDKSFKGELAE